MWSFSLLLKNEEAAAMAKTTTSASEEAKGEKKYLWMKLKFIFDLYKKVSSANNKKKLEFV